jgi:hypothetical protein
METSMNLELDENDIKVILAGLGKLPLEVSLQVYSKLQQQLMEKKADVV